MNNSRNKIARLILLLLFVFIAACSKNQTEKNDKVRSDRKKEVNKIKQNNDSVSKAITECFNDALIDFKTKNSITYSFKEKKDTVFVSVVVPKTNDIEKYSKNGVLTAIHNLLSTCVYSHKKKIQIDLEGDFRYDYVQKFEYGFTVVSKNDKYGIINTQNKEVVPCIYDKIELLGKDIVRISLNEKEGFIGKGGKVLIPPKYKPEVFWDGLSSDFYDLSKGMIAVKLNDNFGFVNELGKEVVKCKYDIVEKFTDNVTSAQRDGQWFIIDKEGKEIPLSKKYSRVSNFIDGTAEVITDYYDKSIDTLSSKCGYIDRSGKEIIPVIYQVELIKYDQRPVSIFICFSEGLVAIRSDKKYGYMNKNGKLITKMQFDRAEPFSEGMAIVVLNDKYGLINKKGKLIKILAYDDVDSFSEGMAKVELKGKHGFINKKGELIGRIEYDYAESFSGGLALVISDRKCGFINKKGEKVIKVIYDDVISFVKGFCIVELDGKYGIIDKDGKIVVPIIYDGDEVNVQMVKICNSKS